MAEQSRLNILFWALVLGAACSPVPLAVKYLGRPDLERPAYFAAFAIALAIKHCWAEHRRWWFWPTVIGIATLHIPLLLSVQWPKAWIPAPIILSFVILDLAAIVAVIRFVAKLDGKINQRSVADR